MSFPTKAERQTCWDSRDRYWDCLDANPTQQDACIKLRQLYETTCPSQWVTHFDRKKNYLKFKERIEKHGIPPPTQVVVPQLACETLPTRRRYRLYRPISWIN